MDTRIVTFLHWGRRRRRWADSTCDDYRRRVTSWLAWCQDKGVRDTRATPRDVQAWLDTLYPSWGVHNAAHTAILAWFDWRVDTQVCKRNPARQVDRVPVRRGVPRSLERDVVRAVLASAHDHGPAIHCYIGLLFYAGLRRAEACSRRWSDIEGQDGWLRVLGKGQQERMVPIHEELRRLIVRHRTANPSREWLFPGRYGDGPICVGTGTNWARRVFDAAGLPEVTSHQGRHSWASALLQGGWDVATVAEALGHHGIGTVLRYTRSRPQRVQEAIASLDW